MCASRPIPDATQVVDGHAGAGKAGSGHTIAVDGSRNMSAVHLLLSFLAHARAISLLRRRGRNALFAWIAGLGVVGCSGGSSSIAGPPAADPPATAPAPAIASVEVAPASVTLDPGQTVALRATVLDAASHPMENRRIRWKSSDVDIASVSDSGVVRARRQGQVVITASHEERRATATIRVRAATPSAPPADSSSGPSAPGSAAPPPVDTVVAVVVWPDSVELPTGRTVALSATLLGSAGDTLDAGVSWSSSDPAVAIVDDSGVVRALAPGSVTVMAAGGSHADTASVRVPDPPPGQVTDLWVTGVDASGVTLSFTEADDGTGAAATYEVRAGSPPFGWDAAAPVSGSCGSLAGSGPGTLVLCRVDGLNPSTDYEFALVAFRVDAVGRVDGPLSNVASARTSAPPPPSQSAGHPNEPAGMTPITERPFDAFGEDRWTNFSNANWSIVSDPGAPASPSGVGAALFPAGGSGGVAHGTNVGSPGLRQSREIYLSFWHRVSANWQGHKSGVNKMFFLQRPGSSSRPAYLSFQGTGAGPFEPQIRLQEAGLARNLGPNENQASAVLARGQWVHWEVYLKYNTGGNADGIARLWIDGVRVINYTNVRFSGTGVSHWWSIVKFNPTWGGTGDTIVQDMYQYLDHAYVSGR
ncbi:MAG: Ig-like domain-containing protein [Gemmatimonadota bacterium]